MHSREELFREAQRQVAARRQQAVTLAQQVSERIRPSRSCGPAKMRSPGLGLSVRSWRQKGPMPKRWLRQNSGSSRLVPDGRSF